MSPKRLKVAFLPVYQNPYQTLLTAALKPLGVTVENYKNIPSYWWLKRERKRVDILHFHWLYGLYMQRFLTPVKWASFILWFRLAKWLGYKIVWTAHNIIPHRMPFPPMHLAVRRLMMAEADAVIAHCAYGKRELLRRFPRERSVYIVPIGSYEDVYPNTTNRTESRAKLKIGEEQFVYLFLGNISQNKGLENFTTLFQEIAAETDLAVIAGRNRAPDLTKRLQRMADMDKRIHIYAGFIPDEEMQFFLHAADVMVAPFQKILTSSSVMVGLSYGLPVIVPDLGCLPELVTREAGIVYPAGDNEGLKRALRQIKQMDLSASGQAAQTISRQLNWHGIGQQTAAIYRSVLD